jgi:alpha-galactosidase
MRVLIAATAIVCLNSPAALFSKISASADGKLLRLDGGGVTYAMGVDEKGYLQPLY